MKRFLTLLLCICAGQLLHAQWGGIGSVNPWTGTDPVIEQANDPFLRFDITDSTIDGDEVAGIHFRDANNNSDGRLFFKYQTDEWFLDDDADVVAATFKFDMDVPNITDTGEGSLRIGPGNNLRMLFDENDIQVRNSANNGTSLNLNRYGGDVSIGSGDARLFLDESAAEIGIGTTNPLAKLHVQNGRVRAEAITASPFFTSSTGYDIYNGTTQKGGISYFQGITLIGSPSHSITLEARDNGVVGINTEGARRVTVDRSGRVGINDSTPSFDLDVNGDGNFTGELTAASDVKLKKDIVAIAGATETINQLNPVTYEFRSDEFPDLKLSEGQRWGLIAQEVEAILPDLVSENGSAIHKNGEEMNIKSLNYIDLIPMMIKAIQEQDAEIQALKALISQK